MDLKQKLVSVVDIYKRVTLSVFTTTGLLFSVALIIIFSPFYLYNNKKWDIPTQWGAVQIFHLDLIGLLLAVLVPILTMALWWVLGTKYAPKFGALLTEKKILNMVITKGDIHYFEKVEAETLRITPNSIISKFINLILAWIAVVAFLLGFLLSLFTGKSKIYTFFTVQWNSGMPIDYLLKIIIIFVLSPLLMSITIPIPWMLIDTKLKAYSSATKTNNFVGRAVQAKLSPLFAIGGLITLIMQNLSIDTIILIVIFVIAILALPSVLMVTLYNMLFQVKYYESFLREIPVPFGTTKVDMEVKFQKQDGKVPENTEESEKSDSDDSSNQ